MFISESPKTHALYTMVMDLNTLTSNHATSGTIHVFITEIHQALKASKDLSRSL